MNLKYESENKDIEYAIKIILENYDRFKKLSSEYEYSKEKSLQSFIASDFSKNSFDKIVNNLASDNFKNKFHTKGSKRQGKYQSTTPFLGIVYSDSRKYLSVSKYLCIAYIFQVDFKGVYLTVSIGSDELVGFNVERFRNTIKNKYFEEFGISIDSNLFKSDNFDLHCTKEVSDKDGYKCNLAHDFEKGMVFNKYYPKNSDELNNENLINDLKKYLKLYEFIIEKIDFDEFRSVTSLKNNKNDISDGEDINKNNSGNCRNFLMYLDDKGFYFNQDTVKNFLLSLKVKPFLILTGNSGTGKTQLAKLFAEYKMCSSNNKYDNYRLVPVGANWTETRHIIGFYNVISKKYVSTPALNLIRNAKVKKDPYFLILDEMNLSHVERYFSDFLSAIESKKEIPLHNSDNGIVDENGKSIEKDLKIPDNLFVIGTVNIDETTYMFSPKVLDRANIIEFETFSKDEKQKLSIEKYMENNFEYDYINEQASSFLENPLTNLELKDIKMNDLKEKFNNDGIWRELSDELTRFHKALNNSNFEFGFRTVNEILAFMYVSKEYERLLGDDDFKNWHYYFDVQIKQKILPKLHGSDMLMDTLEKLLKNCLKDEKKGFESNNIKYFYSAKKINDMIRILKKQKYVSFIN